MRPTVSKPPWKPIIAVITALAILLAPLAPLGSHVARAQQPKQEAQPGPGDEMMGQAKQHFETGKNAYNAGDYVTAIREFKAAEALRPSPILDYNIGLANERLGKLRVAVKYYKRYLDGQPSAANREEVRTKISGLEQQIAAQPAPGGAPTAREQAGDMPPESGPQPGQPGYSAYEPYGATGAPAGPPPPPPKKKSLWWLPLVIVGGAVVLTSTIILYYYNANGGTFAERQSSTAPPPARNDGVLLRF